MRPHPVYATLCTLILAAFPAAALAQPTPNAPPPADQTASSDETVQLPAFEITGQKENSYTGNTALSSTRIAVDLSDLSQSVKVLNSSFISAINPRMASDILEYVGGGQNGALNWTSGRMNIRGFTGDADYTDGFSPTQATNTTQALFDRFEVIKGPSTIFLAADGSPGGIVNKITKIPQATPETSLTLQTGLFEGNDATIDSTGPITADKKLLYRVIADETYYDLYYKNAYLHRFTLMPSLSYQFNPDNKLELKGEIEQVNWPSYNGLPIDPRTLKMIDLPYDSTQDEGAPYNWRHDDVKRIWGSYNSRITPWMALSLRGMNAVDRADRFESITAPWNEGTRTWAAASVTPATYTGGPIPRSVTNDDAYTGYRDAQTDLNFNWTFNRYVTELLLVGAEDRDQPGRTKTYSGNDTTSPWYPYAPGTPPIITTSTIPSAYTSTQSQLERVYALETLKLWDDRIILNFGADRAKVYASNWNYLTQNPATFIPYTIYKNLVQWGAVVKVVPNVSLFTGYNQNFAANGVGTFNGVPNSPLPPKLGEQHEVGIKSDWLDKALTANISYFDINQRNNTVPSFPLDPANPNILIPGVISRGFDGDFSWKVDEHIYLIASFAAYKAKSVLGPAVNGAVGSTFIQPGTGQVAYGSIPVDNTAEHTNSFYFLYDFGHSGQMRGWSMGIGENTQSKRAVTDGPDQVFFGYVPGRTLIDANVNWQMSPHVKWTLNLYNLTDKKYIYSVRSENVQVPGTPFNFKLAVTYSL